MPNRHGPNSWDDYLTVHESRIRDFVGHFILDDRLSFIRTETLVLWQGELVCADGIEIHVTKTQRVWHRQGRPWVETTDYSYHVLRRLGPRVLGLFRYDDAAHHDHPDPHHRHRFDGDGVEIEPPQHVGVEGWPTLGDVIEEAHNLWRAGSGTAGVGRDLP